MQILAPLMHHLASPLTVLLLLLYHMQAAEYRPQLTTLFGRYVDPCLDHCRRNFKTVVPLPAVNQVKPHLHVAAQYALKHFYVPLITNKLRGFIYVLYSTDNLAADP